MVLFFFFQAEAGIRDRSPSRGLGFFFFKQKTAYEIMPSLVGSEMCIRDSSPIYADNIKYVNLVSNEEFGATVEAYMYPDEFAECDGSVEIMPGMYAGQQSRKTFGLAYRTILGLSLIHISEPTRLGMISYAVFCLKKKKINTKEKERACRLTKR